MKHALFGVLIFCSIAGAGKLEPLPVSKIEKIKRGPCTFLHVWATWCTICIQEMPELLKTLAAEKKIHPVVVDVSATFVQEKFSKQWMKNLNPPFTTYLKPKGNEEAYLFAIDKYWSGALPYSALYHQGKQKKVWVGELNRDELKQAATKLCR